MECVIKDRGLSSGNKIIQEPIIVIYRIVLQTIFWECKINSSFDSPVGPTSWFNEICIDFMIFILLFVENFLKYDTIHDFSAWQRAGAYPPDIIPY